MREISKQFKKEAKSDNSGRLLPTELSLLMIMENYPWHLSIIKKYVTSKNITRTQENSESKEFMDDYPWLLI